MRVVLPVIIIGLAWASSPAGASNGAGSTVGSASAPAKPPVAPKPAAGVEKPVRRPSDEERGRELYDRHCLACHGALAAGDGPTVSFLARPPKPLTGLVHDDEETSRVVLKGRAAMPGFEASFDRYDAHRVLKYMAQLGTPKPAQAADTSATPAPTEGPEDAAP